MENKEKKQGIIAGVSLVVMAIAAGFAYGYAHSSLVAGTPDVTLQNLIVNKSLFFAELTGWSIIFITDLVVAIALYFFFRSASKQISAITAFVRIIYTLVLGMAIFQLFRILPALSSANPDASEISSHIQRFEKLWSVGLVVFGLHLIGLGYLSVKSESVPKLLGYLLYFGGVSYTFLHGVRNLNLFEVQTINSIENILALPMAPAEILLAFWLIYFGFRKSNLKTIHSKLLEA
jgi:hypothetical protein